MNDVAEFRKDISGIINLLECWQGEERSIIKTYNSVFSNEERLQFEEHDSSSQKTIDNIKSLRDNFEERIKELEEKEE